MAQKVHVEPYHVFGLCRETRNNLLFLDEHTIIFPSGNNCVLSDIHQRWTKFIPGAMPCRQGEQGIQALALSPDRCYLAVSELREQRTITIYDIQSEQRSKRQVLTGGSNGVHEFVCMAFSADSKYLLGQSGGLDWTLFYWEWETNTAIAMVQTTKLGFVSQVSFNPKDNTQICVSGNCVFKMFKLENNVLNQTSSSEMDQENFMSHAWMSEDCIVSGTETGKLLMLTAGQWQNLGRASERCITAIAPFSKGFACAAAPGLVCLYEKIEEYSYRKTSEIRIPQDPCSSQPSQSEQQEITTICLSPSEEMLAVSTRQGQIYHVSLTSPEISQGKQANFEFLFHSVHLGSITGLSTCSSKPLFATCSKDLSVRIWNYKTKSLELRKEFLEEPNFISLHPNGLSILVGFPDKVCLMNVLVDEFRTVQEFNIHNCSECVFNHDGNVFAAVSDKLINICNIRTGEKVHLNGHINKVQSVMWSKDDRCLVSCGMDGAVYKWDALTGACESSKNLEKSCIYMDAMFSPDTGSVLAVGNNFTLNELRDGKILREMSSDGVAYTAISMTHSCKALFVGTAVGTVRVMQYPLEEEKSWTEYQAHSGPITKMVVTPGDQYLLTASEDGSLLIWAITDQEGRTLDLVKETDYTEEVICTKAYLEEKDQRIQEAYAQVKLLKEDQERKINQNQMDYEKKINKVEQNFLQQIEALNSLIEVLNTEKEELIFFKEKALSEMMKKHTTELKDLDHKHEGQLFKAFRKHDELKKRLQAMEQNHEEKLREHEDNRFYTMMDMKRAYDDKLKDRENRLQQAEDRLKELQEKVDSEFKNVFLQYDLELEKEKETSMKLEYELENQMMQFCKITEEIQDQWLGISQLQIKVEEINSKNKETNQKLEQSLKIQEQELCTERKRATNMNTLVQRMKADIQNCSSFINQPFLLKDNFTRLYKTYIHEADVGVAVKAEVVQEHTRQRELLQKTVVSQKKSQAMDGKIQPTDYSKILKEEVLQEVKSAETEIEQLQNKTREKKQICKYLEAEVEEINSRNKTMQELTQKLNMKETALCTERQRVRNLNTLVQRMKTDIQNCLGFIQQPSLLKENFLKLYQSYIHEADVRVGVKAEVVQEHTRQRELLQKTVVSQKKNQVMEVKTQPADCSKILKKSTMPAEERIQERAKNSQHRTEINIPKKIVTAPFLSIVSSKDSQPNSTKWPVTQESPKIQRLKIDIQDMGQVQAACQSSLGSLKLPAINTKIIE
ncbi:cilia- and flagella-associated protein 57 isoform X1 [Ictalurus punctatus]|uniref:Cilia- and flagella-associated protein 57 isoform X1 n=1 Tax=Ictalurus punctatus TaxID=7998 RepID=A0A2D0T7B4_ICTPU|nr:cilia- and flagella-associated protein 57 isoform X1 [Ictalurus punctatus]